MSQQLEETINNRFGVLPNFFRLAATDPGIAANLWGFAQFGYLDNPLPSLFKERLFVYLSRFCEIRYCIARHVGFLVGLGRPAGDAACVPQTVDAVLPLLRRPLPHGDALTPHLEICAALGCPLSNFPAPESEGEIALFACATHVFLQTHDAERANDILGVVLDRSNLEHLKVFLAFVRTAHYWTKIHPELLIEEDVCHLLDAHEGLAACILNDPESDESNLGRQVAAELALLRELKSEHEVMSRAFHALATDHQSVKETLYAREASLKQLVAAMPAAVYACDSAGRLTYYNRQAADLWGSEPASGGQLWSFLDSQRLYRSDGTAFRPEELPVKEVLATGIPVSNRELVLERPDRSRVSVLVNIAPLRDGRDLVSGAVNIFQDISALKRVQQDRERLMQELECSNRELSEFSYSVSHDLQAPVNAIRLLTRILLDRTRSSEDASHLVGLIHQSADGMQRLIESLLSYAQAGQGELRRQTVSVERVIELVEVSLADLIAETEAVIIRKILPAVDGDPVLLEQLFQNLVANAIKYRRLDEPPVIKISSEREEGGWQFAVKDNGRGISQEHRYTVFEPLKRLHGSDTPGMGLGLALCQTIVARHGGRIWLESNGEGPGATFLFTLPG